MFDGLYMFGIAVTGYLTPVSLGLAFGAGAAGLVLAEQLGGLFPETFGVVKFGLDALGAMIERRQHRLVDAEIGKQHHEDDEGDRDPGFRLGKHPSHPFNVASTALLTVLPSGSTPVRRCTIAPAASRTTTSPSCSSFSLATAPARSPGSIT